MRPGRLPVAAAAYTFFVTMLGTTLPTPLYRLYRDHLHFSPVVQTTIFAVYAFGVMAALVVAGQASDALGRRPVLLAGLICATVSGLVFLIPASLPSLLLGRLLSGFSAGLFTGTATTALVELAEPNRRRAAALVATAANILGLGCGPLLAGLLAWGLPHPLVIPYLVHLALVAVAIALTARQPETVTDPREARPRWRVLRPSVPEQVRTAFVPAATSSFAGFAMMGLFTAVEPLFLADVLHIDSLVAAGAVVTLVFASSVAAQVASARAGDLALPVGCGLLVAGMALLVVALHTASLGVLLAACVVLGSGQGTVFRAGVASVSRDAPSARRGEVTSTLFLVLYVGTSVPVIGVGALTQAIGLTAATDVFAAFIALLAIVAAAVSVRASAR